MAEHALLSYDRRGAKKNFSEAGVNEFYAKIVAKNGFSKDFLKRMSLSGLSRTYTNFWTLISIRLGNLFYGHKGLLL